ncbi:protein involved in biosynthesis of mitomycin antibiotics/polyketide fumonisin [Rivularia sp. PCC 7116]|nr:protein involved in biosynthesis of mitomycin antibiotics/polyketide fumonisin [Rivularia sp. PCC 7116]
MPDAQCPMPNAQFPNYMNESERYLFDLQGFLVVENVLTDDEILALRKLVDKQVAIKNQPEASKLRFDGLLSWGKPFLNLIDNPRITPYLSELLGKFRLDHDYLHIIREGLGPIGCYLHGGGTPYDPTQYYSFRNGRIYNGLLAVAYELNDVHPGDGGFACIPGSHKSNLACPQEWINLEFPRDIVKSVAVKAGSAIIFTEALSHGTLPWQGKNERRTLFYKYSPGSYAWLRNYYNPEEFEDLTASQREMLKTPGVYP